MRAARIAAGLVLAAASLVAAEDSTAKKAAETEDGIVAAKRDLETIRAMRSPSTEASRGEAPHFSVPEMQLGAGGPTRAGAAPGNPKAKTANWLVDAMAKRTDKAVDGIKTAERERENAASESADARSADERPKRDSAEAQPRSDKKTADDAGSNPLAAYMAGWMTPQDYKLLRPTIEVEGVVVPGKSADAPGQSFLSGSAGSGGAKGEQKFGDTRSRATGNAQRENPFLHALSAPVTSAGALGPGTAQLPQPATAASKSPAPVALSPAPVTQQSARPAFAKPPDDTKYFKPLKKF